MACGTIQKDRVELWKKGARFRVNPDTDRQTQRESQYIKLGGMMELWATCAISYGFGSFVLGVDP